MHTTTYNPIFENLILNTDSYKQSHFLMFPPDTKYISAYVESRGGVYDKTVFFGIQMFIKQYLLKPITQEMIDEAESILIPHGLPFNKKGWQYILDEHNGYLPLLIEAVPEGTIIPTLNVLAQVINTDPNCAWLVGVIETAILRACWYGTTVATKSNSIKSIIKKYLNETSDNIDSLDYKLIDFGARGVSSQESASIGGLAHLINFKGSDTLAGLLAARQYYHADIASHSVAASEHSCTVSWGKEYEYQAYKNMLDTFLKKDKALSIVPDSYNLWDAIEQFGTTFKEQIINSGGTLVLRPDSGVPVEIIEKVMIQLERLFGMSLNSKGYKILPDCIRVLQGDGVTQEAIVEILQMLKDKGYSTDNILFGSGGYLLQMCDRDTLKFAYKASAIQRNGIWMDCFKDPITDTGKRSKRGRLALIKNDNHEFETIRKTDIGHRENVLRPIFENGKLLVDDTLEQIRERVL